MACTATPYIKTLFLHACLSYTTVHVFGAICSRARSIGVLIRRLCQYRLRVQLQQTAIRVWAGVLFILSDSDDRVDFPTEHRPLSLLLLLSLLLFRVDTLLKLIVFVIRHAVPRYF